MPCDASGIGRVGRSGLALAILFFLLVAAAACTGDPPPTSAAAPDPSATPTPTDAGTSAVRPTPTARPTSTPEPTPDAPTSQPAPEPAPRFWADVLAPGDCLNRSDLADDDLPSPIACGEFHEVEIYAIAAIDLADDAAYPGRDALAAIAQGEVCSDATVEFAGRGDPPFPTSTIVPSQSDWAEGDRSVFCVARPRALAEVKIGTAAGVARTIDEALAVRVATSHPNLGDFVDWLVVEDGDDLAHGTSLTDGSHDLALDRPVVSDDGILVRTSDAEAHDLLLRSDGTTGDASAVAERPSLGAPAGDYRSISPDGRHMVYRHDRDLWVATISPTGVAGEPRQLTDTAADEWESAISPDGSWVAFASNRSGNDDIWLVPIEGGEAINMTEHPADESWPAWSVDGSIVYFASDRLAPRHDQNVVMAMLPDGSRSSYVMGFPGNQAIPLDADIAAQLRTAYPTLDERHNFTLITGEPGTATTWVHPSERLAARLPVGWRVIETAERPGALAGFFAAPRPSEAERRWDRDALAAALVEAPSFFDFVNEVVLGARPFEACTIIGRPEEDGETASVILGARSRPDLREISAEFDCDGSLATVTGLWGRSDGLGLLIERQEDRWPSRDEPGSASALDAVIASLDWS
ncbi:MAG: septum formation family protein [Actinomycetota bacterium]